jgi:hypothetical protein
VGERMLIVVDIAAMLTAQDMGVLRTAAHAA